MSEEGIRRNTTTLRRTATPSVTALASTIDSVSFNITNNDSQNVSISWRLELEINPGFFNAHSSGTQNNVAAFSSFVQTIASTANLNVGGGFGRTQPPPEVGPSVANYRLVEVRATAGSAVTSFDASSVNSTTLPVVVSAFVATGDKTSSSVSFVITNQDSANAFFS